MKSQFTDLQYDLYRICGKTDKKSMFHYFLDNRAYRKLFYFRTIKNATGIKKFIIRVLMHMLNKKISIEFANTLSIGKGALFMHPEAIVITSKAVIGDNFTILKGATVGNNGIVKSEKSCAPKIGNNVYIGLNSTVVGDITIGNDVMIAANTFVNFDVPDGALVIGSPGVIHQKTNASRPYILNSIEEL